MAYSYSIGYHMAQHFDGGNVNFDKFSAIHYEFLNQACASQNMPVFLEIAHVQ